MSYPLFPVTADLPVLESYEWLTDIHEGWDGSEQRVKLRREYRRFYEIAFALKRMDKALLDAAIFANIAHETTGVPDRKKWTLPIWNDMQTLAAELAAGAALVYANWTGYDFHSGGLVALIKGRASREWDRFRVLREEDYEIMTVDSTASDVDGEYIVFTDTTTKDFVAGDLILPARVAWPEGEIDILDVSEDEQAYTGHASFQCEIEIPPMGD